MYHYIHYQLVGLIEANGGDGALESAGGGGGRIAVYYAQSDYAGSITAYGGRANGTKTGGLHFYRLF